VRRLWSIWLWLTICPLIVAYVLYAASRLAFGAVGLWALSIGLYWTFAWFYVGIALAGVGLLALVVRGFLAARVHLRV
jgi:hypothetical protein